MRLGAVVLIGLAAAGVGCGITGPSRVCRRYATARSSPGYLPDECALDATRYMCGHIAGGYNDWTTIWVYRSTDDFIDEAQTPNRIMAVQRIRISSSVGPSPAGGLSVGRTNYEYDSQGRLASLHDILYGFTIVFDEWDSVGRPRAGTKSAGVTGIRVTIAYDDVARTMEWSTGEFTGQDRDGNLIRSGSIEWSITATEEVCK